MSDIWERKEFSQFTTHAAPEVDCDEEEELVRGCGGRDASLEIKDIVLRFGEGRQLSDASSSDILVAKINISFDFGQNNIRWCISKNV